MEYGEIGLGDRYTLQKTLTEDAVRQFADFSGDYNPVHMDDDYCRQKGMGGRIVHGMLVLSYLSALIGMYLPGNGSVWMSQTIDFLAPAHIGDTLDISGEVASKSEANALGLHIVKLRIQIRNQTGALLMKGHVAVAVK